jgi:hypothetical protein
VGFICGAHIFWNLSCKLSHFASAIWRSPWKKAGQGQEMMTSIWISQNVAGDIGRVYECQTRASYSTSLRNGGCAEDAPSYRFVLKPFRTQTQPNSVVRIALLPTAAI